MLSIPALRGTIDRRILVNYRADPEVVRRLLPEPFRPQTVSGHAVVGICLIRLTQMRPRGLPAWVTLGSENAAHRVAAEWDEGGVTRQGVYVPRRDTSSCAVSLLGGRVFPGTMHRARFEVSETENELSVSMVSADGETRISVQASPTADLKSVTLFSSLSEASDFFERGSVAFSPGNQPDTYDGLQLHSDVWRVEPLMVQRVSSSYYENAELFPPGSVQFDNALLMRRIGHEWRGAGRVRVTLSGTGRRSA